MLSFIQEPTSTDVCLRSKQIMVNKYSRDSVLIIYMSQYRKQQRHLNLQHSINQRLIIIRELFIKSNLCTAETETNTDGKQKNQRAEMVLLHC